ncbi:hypothetical protein F5050DRAFT_1713621 [Lentinula boryana]|uniref:Uncharacterized protein n=1 Tax=Lentinula boryana TaxID=40481 RepID=A0ABQ8Q7N5_9AGAR|nr:hypothetical protein F5050DRAFT_1713621 [Lentinula boryana]
MKFFTASLSLCLVSISQLVFSSPILVSRAADSELDVWSPTITYPKGEYIVWESGSTVYNMTWETANIPERAQNNTGIIMLGYLDDNDDSSDEHLDWKYPLVSGFPISEGIAHFTIDPARNLTTRDSYVLCLLGDSGNISDRLTIEAAQT